MTDLRADLRFAADALGLLCGVAFIAGFAALAYGLFGGAA